MPDDNKIKTPDYDPENPRCDQEQYDMLIRCSEKMDMTEWNKWRKKNPKEEIFLEGANIAKARRVSDTQEVFHMAHLKGVILDKAHLEGADLREAHLQCAFLNYAHLEKAKLENAHLEGATLHAAHLEGASLLGASLNDADFMFANLNGAILNSADLKGAQLPYAQLKGTYLIEVSIEGASFEKAIVDNSTFLWECKVDRHSAYKKGTNFIGVGFDRLRIDPATKQLLEYNVRRRNWEQWYKEHSKLKCLVKPFWLMSDYGMSTWRIILTFLILAIIFATVYFTCGAVDFYCLGIKDQPGIVNDLFVPATAEKPISSIYYGVIIYLRSVYFSVVTMTTLGFGDMFANTASFGLRWWLGHILLIIQVILGYVLLGALVTRFAVLFTAGGPAGKFEKVNKKSKNK